jgi:hypothetical protein
MVVAKMGAKVEDVILRHDPKALFTAVAAGRRHYFCQPGYVAAAA